MVERIGVVVLLLLLLLLLLSIEFVEERQERTEIFGILERHEMDSIEDRRMLHDQVV